MSDTDKKPDQEKGDEILRRMLNTPPDPKKSKTEKQPTEKTNDEV